MSSSTVTCGSTRKPPFSSRCARSFELTGGQTCSGNNADQRQGDVALAVDRELTRQVGLSEYRHPNPVARTE
jgi:hypothetical protein